ncbi:cell division protein FtsQ/DivIB [Tepidamorphus sp. 3E244]|uniref:cell division protein FtsQ/DivIB n=1 Tax=Tepidamorphus sp. 3E244 TaxID=3385498 RepID=UPI0038FD3EB6
MAGVWLDRATERLSRPNATEAIGQVCGVVVLAGSVIFGIVTGGHAEAFGQGLLRVVDGAAASSGLRITSVEISGNEVLDDEAIVDTAGLLPGVSLIGIDANRARDRLQALPWVASARVQKFFPDTLSIDVVERVPFAVWQHDGQFHIIDRTGVLLRPASVDQLPELPVVVGAGAADSAANLIAELLRHPAVARHVIAGVRIADRRWSLHLDNGIEIKLPEQGMEHALSRLSKLANEGDILRRDLKTIDLRIAGRVFVLPREETGDKTSAKEARS